METAIPEKAETVWRARLIYTLHQLLVGSGYRLLPGWRLRSNGDSHKHAKRPPHDMSYEEGGVDLQKLLSPAWRQRRQNGTKPLDTLVT